MINNTLFHGKVNNAMNKSSKKGVKLFTLVMLLLSLALGAKAYPVDMGQNRDYELTVYDGTTTNNYVPAYVFYFDDFTRSQFVIPGADLDSMIGSNITSVKFYTTSNNMPYTTVSTVDIYLKEVDYASISAFEAKADCQVVYTGMLDFVAEGEGGGCVITFDTPFTYYGGNLLVGCENTTDAGWKNIYFYGQPVNGASIAGYNNSSLDNVPATQRNFIPKTTLYYSLVDPVPYLVATPDPVDLGHRPNGAWMRPLEVNIFNLGSETIINNVAISNNNYFLLNLEGVNVPFTLDHNNGFNLNLSTVGTASGTVNENLVVNYGDNEVTLFDVSATAYTPVNPDVWEVAQQVSSFPFTATLNANSIPLYDNYRLPPTSIADGADAVYKLVFTEDTYLNASVTSGENGKVALYTEDFNGVGGPDLENRYTRPQIGGNNAPFTALIGEGTNTSGYLPFYCFYNYSLSQQLYLPAELEEAGVTLAPMNSISWYCTSTNNNLQSNITIWMANVGESAVNADSPLTSNMTKVYEGNMTPVANAWNEFVFNTGSFAWDGNSSILVLVQRNNGAWASGVNWQVGAQNFNAGAYKYSDTEGPYDMETTSYNMNTTTNRANTIFKSVGRRSLPMLSTSTNNHGVNTNTSLNRDGWMFYDDGAYGTSIGVGGGIVYWGSMFPVSMLSGNNLTKVALYENDYNIDTVTLYVYQGGSEAPETLVYSQTFTPVGGDQFHEVNLTNPVTIDPSQNLWIMFSENGTYPANACVDTGYPNNRWVSLDGVDWYDIADLGVPGYGWMIRAYIEGNVVAGSINDLTVTPGTYYLVASSTSDEFTVEINTDEVPCPELAINPSPADAAMEVNTYALLSWNLDSRATEYRLLFGTSYYCEDTLVDWTDELSERFFVTGLNNNTNYFWRIDQRNDGCPEGVLGQVWGFTTHLNVPQNLIAVDETVFNDEIITLNWNAVADRAYQMYNVYRDGEYIGYTTPNDINATTFIDGPLPYNMVGYTYYVTAVYEEGESLPSNTVTVRVSGYGNVNGHVYEQDGITSIANATVTMIGYDEFGINRTFDLQTNDEGYYSGLICAGNYYGIANHSGYQEAQHDYFTITYNELTSDINFVMDEVFYPVAQVLAEYYPDANDPNSPFVKVYWATNWSVEDFETGDFSIFDWQTDPTYPWSITTTNPYEGQYCMKSGGAGVANVVSNMTVTVNIPADGVMSYFGKISSETSWDFGYFYIDGVQKGSYSGASNWAERTFDITAGEHTFKWQYTKDGSIDSNDDCFYVDYITFYKRPEPTQPAESGWHTYAESEFNNAVGSNVGTSRWAYEYPVSLLEYYAGFNLTKVSLFSDNMYSAVGGNYTCTIYQGGSLPMEGTAVSTITVDVPQNQNAWVDFDLTTPVSISGNDNLWVVWTANSSASSWPAGCCDGLVEEGTWWSAGLEAGYEWDHQTYGTWTMRQYFTNREGRGFYSYASDDAPVAVEAPVVVKGAPIMPVKGVETMTTTCVNPNAVPSARINNHSTRALSSYKVYRTNAYNYGPYTIENTEVLASGLQDTLYIDVNWSDVATGVYKWGVSCVYEGNRGEEMEGEINWSEPIAIAPKMANQVFDFEDGLIPTDWVNDTTYPWVVGTPAYPGYNGTYCMMSGNSGIANSTSVMEATVIFAEDGSISFLGGCWGEGTSTIWDKCQFFIDGNEQFSYGALQSWHTYSFNVTAGTHTFRWSYTKDSSVNPIGDVFFIDDITFEPRESEIVWSNRLDKNMYLMNNEVNITVSLNSADSPEGTTVSFTNLNPGEQQLHPVADVTLGNTGYYAWNSFRKGDYKVMVSKEGFTTINANVSIWDATSLSYMLEEIIPFVSDLYVSSTGWAMWEYSENGDTFSYDFDNGMPSDWTTIDADGDGYNWNLGSNIMGTGYGHNGSSDMIFSQSYDNNYGVLYPDNYLVSPQVTLAAGSTFSFYACAQDASWAAEHFGVAISDNGTSDWTMVQEWTMTAKSGGDVMSIGRGGNTRAQGNWYYYSVDLSAYAGQKYIAIRHFNCSDWFYLDVDDIELTFGRNGGRHLEYSQVMLTDIQDNVLFSGNTMNPFFQLPVDDLIEGETYRCKVASVYTTGMTEWAEVEWVYQACNNYEGVSNLFATNTGEGNLISWTYPIEEGDKNRDECIFFNGFVTDPGVMDDGADASWTKNNQSTWGPGCQQANNNWIADSFTLDGTKTINEITVYGYQTGSSTTSTFDGLYIQIYDGNPMSGANVVWGDANTNIMTATAFTNCYRGSDGDATGMTRPIMSITSSGLNIELGAGTYYLAYQLSGTGSSGPWGAPHAEPSIGNTGNGVQYLGSSEYWQDLFDSGAGTSYGCAFRLDNNRPSVLGAMVYRDNELVGFTSDNSFLDQGEMSIHQYTIRVVYTGIAICPANNIYYSMSCPQTAFMGETFQITATANPSTGGTITGTGIYGEGQTCTLTANANEGYTFTNWTKDGIIVSSTSSYSFTVTEDASYVANFSSDENHWGIDVYQYPYNMSVTGIIQINGVEQQTNALEIGAFCGDECRGAQRLTYFPQVDRYLVFFTLYGDAGDVMSFRLYDHVVGEELDMACSSTIAFVPDGFIGTPFDPYVFDFGNMMAEQVSNFSQGYNWWGTYIEQNGIDGLSMLQDGLGDNGITIRSQASGYNDYYAGYGWFGSLSGINNESSYRVITSAPCTVTMTGNAAIPSEHPITLSQGWTWISYVPSTAMDVNVAMAGINAANGDMLKSQHGYADYYPGYGWFGSLNTLEPGMGLMYYSTNSQPVTFTYPNSRNGALKANITAENNHWVPNVYAYPDNMTVMAIVELNNEELNSENFELAAFDASGICRGSVKLIYADLLHRHVAFLTISGKDAAELSFRLYDTETGMEYYNAEESLNFIANAIVGDADDLYVVHFRGTTGTGEFANNVQVYPNPVAPGECFSIGMDVESKAPVRVEIINALGAVVSAETSTRIPTSMVAPNTVGVYTVRIITEDKEVLCRKLIVK